MADAGQMHANLVRAAGANAHLKQRELLETSQHLVIGDRGAAGVEPCGHARTPHRVPGDRFHDASGIRFHRTMHQRDVHFLYGSHCELTGQAQMRGVATGHQKNAAGIAVNAMHDARPRVAAHG